MPVRHSTASALSVLLTMVPVTRCVAQQSSDTSRDLYISRDAKRVALLIGNNEYPRGPLINAVNDARGMGEALRQLGFEVHSTENANRRTIVESIDRFVNQLGSGDVALFYYAGHGVQIDGENYLVPIDFEGRDESDLKYFAYPAGQLHDKMDRSGARLKMIILDACRNNPFRVSRSASGGLAQMNTGIGSFIAFATGPGMVANDSPGSKNGLFTENLISVLREPGLSLPQVFDRVRERVARASGSVQVPWTSSSVVGDFFFRPGVTLEAAAATREREEALRQIRERDARLRELEARAIKAEALTAKAKTDEQSAIEREMWQWASQSKQIPVLEGYLSKYPEGRFSREAGQLLAELRKAATVVAKVSPPTSALRLLEQREVPKLGDLRESPVDELKYVYVPEGVFEMGCVELDAKCQEDEKPRVQVRIEKAFWISRTETTVLAYRRFIEQSGNRSMPPPTQTNPNWRDTYHPITRVSWFDASEYCKWAGGRLPTEAEWEYAARAGNEGFIFPWGNELDRDHANFDGRTKNARDKYDNTAPVATFAANDWGIYDMTGNVSEWVADSYAPRLGSAVANDVETQDTERVVRGGSFVAAENQLRLSAREHFPAKNSGNRLGFRCVVSE